jgi:hypothetical protein
MSDIISPARCPGCNAANGELHALMCVFRAAEPAPAQPQAERMECLLSAQIDLLRAELADLKAHTATSVAREIHAYLEKVRKQKPIGYIATSAATWLHEREGQPHTWKEIRIYVSPPDMFENEPLYAAPMSQPAPAQSQAESAPTAQPVQAAPVSASQHQARAGGDMTDDPKPVAWIHQWAPHSPVIGKSLHWTAHTPHANAQVIRTPLFDRPTLDAAIAQAVAAERERMNQHAGALAETARLVEKERCLDICEQHYSIEGIAHDIAAAIRALTPTAPP